MITLAYKLRSEVSEHPRMRAAHAVCEKLRASGRCAFWVGGAVRDLLLNPKKVPKDVDIATDATFDEICKYLPQTKAIGKAFGVGLVSEGDFTFEVATFRKESDYADRRHPSFVTAGNLEEDSLRRDFTINALYLDPVAELIVDHHGGIEDLAAGLLRCVGEPEVRLNEDPLRILRLYRFAANLNLEIEKGTAAAAISLADALRSVSRERVLLEISKLTASALPDFAKNMMQFQNTLLGGKCITAAKGLSPATRCPVLPQDAFAFAGTIFALMCTANEGLSARNWQETLKQWPLSAEEKAQFEFYLRVAHGQLNFPDSQSEDDWKPFLENFRWLQRQSRITTGALGWLAQWPTPQLTTQPTFINALAAACSASVHPQETPLNTFIEGMIRNRAVHVREELQKRLSNGQPKTALGWARLIADCAVLLNELDLNSRTLPSILRPPESSDIGLLSSTATRWSAD